MLAEGIHSVVDTLNQVLLLIGLKRAEKPADAKHPFGHGREIYFFSFVVALLIFLAGGLFSIYEGVHKILTPEPEAAVTLFGHEVSALLVNFSILGFSIAVEGYSLYVAARAMPRGSPLSTIRRSKDPSLFVVLVEDTAAVSGLVIAALGVGLAHWLALPVLDGAASVTIGVLLIGMAFFLMVETHGLLIGEAAAPDIVAAIERMARQEPSVRHVNEVLTQHFGPSDILINLSLDLDNSLDANGVEALVGRLDAGLKAEIEGATRVFVEIQARG